MSSLYYKHQLHETYNSWKLSLNQICSLLDQLDKEVQYIKDPKDKALFQKRINAISVNYDKQIDLVNQLYWFIENQTVDKDTLSYTKEKLDIARQFIASLGGDPSSINWLKKSDFYR
jgi:hypothetical protein